MNSLLDDEAYIKLTIELAKKGESFVSPNPMVGAVIVKNNAIIGVGYHAKFGENHAEINAFAACKENPEGATLYVNLEPCSHYGKTPPCVNAIIEKKVKRVVIGTLDPNPLVAGNGVRLLKEAGIEVKIDVLKKECLELNKIFFKHITSKLPYIHLKVAQTLDSKIADKYFKSKWITCAESRTYVHELRNIYDAVLIGSNTVKIDNPELSVRLLEGRNPYRIVINSDCSLSNEYKIFNMKDGKTILVCSEIYKANFKKLKLFEELGVNVVFAEQNKKGKLKYKSVLQQLYKIGIYSILVEGGARIFTNFIKKGLFDELDVFISPKILGNGLAPFEDIGVKKLSKAIPLKLNKVLTLGDDVLLNYLKVK